MMITPRLLLCLFALTGFFPTAGRAAPVTLNLLSPLDFQVFQRQTKAEGRILVDCALGTSERGAVTNIDKLEARLTGKSAAGKLPGAWQALPFDGRARRFRAELT